MSEQTLAGRATINGPFSCGRQAKTVLSRAEDGKVIVQVPMAVIWEVSILARIVRINVRRSVGALFDDLFSNPAFQPFDLTPAQVFAADDLRFTRDGFDGLIAAAARDLGLDVITRDTAIIESGAVETVWQSRSFVPGAGARTGI